MGKKEILDLIQRLPDGVTEAEILQELHFRLQVERGLKDVEADRVLSHEALKGRMAEWRNAAGA